MSDSKPADGPKKINESMDLYASLPYFPYMDTRDLFAEVGPYGFLDGVPQQYMTRRDNRMAGELLPLYINWWQLKIIRDRSRQIARNNEFAISAINAHRNYVVGTGFTYTVQARYDGANLDLIKKTQDLVDLLVEHNRMPEIESEIIYRLHADGEAFLRFFAGSDGLLRIRFIEPELIRPPADDTTPNNSFGIKCDDDDIHDITGYWVIERPWFDLTPTLVPADQILHLKINSESNSKRGLPTIYAVESNLRAAEDVLQSMIALAKARSKIAVIRKVNDSPPDAVAELARTATDFTVSDPIQNRNTNISHMGYGSILTTTGNVGYEFPSLNVGSGDLVETLNANLRAIASRFGITETMMSADASNNNYASALVAEAPAVKTFERMQRMLGQAIGERRTRPERSLIWNQITHAVNMGMLPRDVFEQVTIRAKGPSLVSRNRNEEASVAKQYYDMGLWSPQTITADSGKNYEEEQRNIAKSREESAKNPMLSNHNLGIEPPAMGDQSTDLPKQADGPDQVQDTALNGAQVTSLVDLATQVAQGVLPLETAQAIASAAFPAVSKELIGQIFDPIEPSPTASGNVSEAEKYSHIDFSPPEGVRKAAARGLELRKKHGRGGTAVGVARARTLSNGQKVTPETAKRMHSYFARHEVDKQGEGWGEDSAGYIAWLLWGGDAGKSWSAKLVKQIDAADKKEGIEIVGPTGTYDGAVPEGRWVTMGQGEGGTPVYLDDAGHIEKGPSSTVGKKPNELGKKNDPEKPKQPEPKPSSDPEFDRLLAKMGKRSTQKQKDAAAKRRALKKLGDSEKSFKDILANAEKMLANAPKGVDTTPINGIVDRAKKNLADIQANISSLQKKESEDSIYEVDEAMDDKISDKIKLLMDEGKPQQQAVAIALSMARRGEL